MNKNPFMFVVIGLVLMVFCLFFWRSSHLETLSKEYGQVVSLSSSHLSYRSMQLPLSGSGLLFYQVQLKEVPFAHTIDKISVEVEGNEVHFSLTGVSFDVSDALRVLKGEGLVGDLKNYIPYHSIWTQPLESLALAGIERVKFNASFVLKNTGVARQIKGEVQDKKIGKVIFDFSLPENNGLVSVASLTAAPFTHGAFSVEDVAFEAPYRAYAKSIGYTAPPQGLKNVLVNTAQKVLPITKMY